jgi:hypothetical protein
MEKNDPMLDALERKKKKKALELRIQILGAGDDEADAQDYDEMDEEMLSDDVETLEDLEDADMEEELTEEELEMLKASEEEDEDDMELAPFGKKLKK